MKLIDFFTKPVQIQLVMILMVVTAFFIGGMTIGAVKAIKSPMCAGTQE